MSSPIAACALAITSALTLRSSNTASITRSQSFERAVVRRRRDPREQRVALGRRSRGPC